MTAREVCLWLGPIIPVQGSLKHPRKSQRRVNLAVAIRGSGLHQQHLCVRIFRQSSGKRTSGCARADDDVVKHFLSRYRGAHTPRYDGDLGAKSSGTRKAILILIYAASLASLVWTLRDAGFAELWDDIEHLNPAWIAVGVASMIAVYFVQGVRWSLILAPVAKLQVHHAARAVFVGLFASEVFPIRAGEIIRCYLVSRWTELPFSVTFASVLIERLFDALMMWIALQYALQTVQVPASQRIAVDSLGVIVLVGFVVLGAALFRPKLKHQEMPAGGWRKRWFVLQEDLALIGHSWYLWAALLATIPYLLLQVVPVYILFREYDFGLNFGAALALMMLIRIAAAVPQAPATLGLFQFLAREFLELGFQIPSDQAARFSLVLWAVVKIPLLVSGAIAVAITGTKLSELTHAAHQEHQSSSS